MVSFSESKNQLPSLKLFWTHIQSFHLPLVIEIIWTKKYELPTDANKSFRAAAPWLPLRGQLEPHCSLGKCVTPHVVCGTFHRLFPAMNNTTENTPDERKLQPKGLFNLNLIISGFLVLMAKSTGLFWTPSQYASFWNIFLPLAVHQTIKHQHSTYVQ